MRAYAGVAVRCVLLTTGLLVGATAVAQQPDPDLRRSLRAAPGEVRLLLIDPPAGLAPQLQETVTPFQHEERSGSVGRSVSLDSLARALWRSATVLLVCEMPVVRSDRHVSDGMPILRPDSARADPRPRDRPLCAHR